MQVREIRAGDKLVAGNNQGDDRVRVAAGPPEEFGKPFTVRVPLQDGGGLFASPDDEAAPNAGYFLVPAGNTVG